MDPDKNQEDDNNQAQRDAATNVVRDQLDALYGGQARVTTPPAENPAAQKAEPQAYKTQSGHMQEYHSQWQNYYRKYYEHYYVGKLHEAITEKSEAPAEPKTKSEERDEEVAELREKIVTTAKTSAKKARKSRHFIPIASALAVVLIVAFLQYNEIIFANVQAYISPGAIDPQNIVIDPTSNTRVSAEPRLIIPKINVDVPVIYDVGYDHDSQMAAMQKGVAHFAIPGAESKPGQIGNTVFSGHSSNDLFDPGDYKFIFAQLDKLTTGDTIFVNYNSTRYTYTVSKKIVVQPSNVGALLDNPTKPYLTLITCTPLGTATNRLLVYADQVAPDPSKATPVSASAGSGDAAMPGNAPTALERLFGAR
jgi:sortase A